MAAAMSSPGGFAPPTPLPATARLLGFLGGLAQQAAPAPAPAPVPPTAMPTVAAPVVTEVIDTYFPPDAGSSSASDATAAAPAAAAAAVSAPVAGAAAAAAPAVPAAAAAAATPAAPAAAPRLPSPPPPSSSWWDALLSPARSLARASTPAAAAASATPATSTTTAAVATAPAGTPAPTPARPLQHAHLPTPFDDDSAALPFAALLDWRTRMRATPRLRDAAATHVARLAAGDPAKLPATGQYSAGGIAEVIVGRMAAHGMTAPAWSVDDVSEDGGPMPTSPLAPPPAPRGLDGVDDTATGCRLPAAHARAVLRDCLEHALAARVYPTYFAAAPGERAVDVDLWQRVTALRGQLAPSHLDLPDELLPASARRPQTVPPGSSDSDGGGGGGGDAGWRAVWTALGGIAAVRAPRDMLVCLVRATRLLASLTSAARAHAAAVAAAAALPPPSVSSVPAAPATPLRPGAAAATPAATPAVPATPARPVTAPPLCDAHATADDLLPAWVLALVYAPPAAILNLPSALAYIRRFRGAPALCDEAGYVLTLVESAVAFVVGLTPPYSLTRWGGDEGSWQRHLDAVRARCDAPAHAAAVADARAGHASMSPADAFMAAVLAPTAVGTGGTAPVAAAAEHGGEPAPPAAAPAAAPADVPPAPIPLAAIAAVLVPPVSAMQPAQLPEALSAWVADRTALAHVTTAEDLTLGQARTLIEEYHNLCASLSAVTALLAVHRRDDLLIRLHSQAP